MDDKIVNKEIEVDNERVFPDKKGWVREKIEDNRGLIMDVSPDNVRLKGWVEQHSEGGAKLFAEFVSRNINYITFENFVSNLYDMCGELRQKVGERPLAIVTKVRGKSERWVYDLAKEILPKNHFLIQYDEVKMGMIARPDVEDILYLDDASYSGNNMVSVADALEEGLEDGRKLNFYPGTVYATSCSERSIGIKCGRSEKLNLVDLESRCQIKTIEELINEVGDEVTKEKLFAFVGLGIDLSRILTLTTLQHKTPDGQSLWNGVGEGYITGNDGRYIIENKNGQEVNKRFRFLPLTIPPYRTDVSEAVRMKAILVDKCKAVIQRTIVKRTPRGRMVT